MEQGSNRYLLPFDTIVSAVNGEEQAMNEVLQCYDRYIAGLSMENALKALEQAKARVANERKKLNEKRRKEENHHKYMMGGIVVKYFPECYQFDEAELNKILRVTLATNECQQIIRNIKGQNGGNANQNTVEQDRADRGGANA